MWILNMLLGKNKIYFIQTYNFSGYRALSSRFSSRSSDSRCTNFWRNIPVKKNFFLSSWHCMMLSGEGQTIIINLNSIFWVNQKPYVGIRIKHLLLTPRPCTLSEIPDIVTAHSWWNKSRSTDVDRRRWLDGFWHSPYLFMWPCQLYINNTWQDANVRKGNMCVLYNLVQIGTESRPLADNCKTYCYILRPSVHKFNYFCWPRWRTMFLSM